MGATFSDESACGTTWVYPLPLLDRWVPIVPIITQRMTMIYSTPTMTMERHPLFIPPPSINQNSGSRMRGLEGPADRHASMQVIKTSSSCHIITSSCNSMSSAPSSQSSSSSSSSLCGGWESMRMATEMVRVMLTKLNHHHHHLSPCSTPRPINHLLLSFHNFLLFFILIIIVIIIIMLCHCQQ